jgi:hypothetical protein
MIWNATHPFIFHSIFLLPSYTQLVTVALTVCSRFSHAAIRMKEEVNNSSSYPILQREGGEGGRYTIATLNTVSTWPAFLNLLSFSCCGVLCELPSRESKWLVVVFLDRNSFGIQLEPITTQTEFVVFEFDSFCGGDLPRRYSDAIYYFTHFSMTF